MDPALVGAIINSITTILVGAGIGFFGAKKLEKIKSVLGVETQHKLEALKRKREIYEEMTKGIQFLIDGRLEDEESKEHKKTALLNYDKLSLWASKEVCDAADNLFRSLADSEGDEVTKERYRDFLSAMRKDLGLDENEIEYRRNYQFIS